MNTLQDAGERPSYYLNRLQVVLSKAARRGGVAAIEQERHLLRQFCRGCWDSALLADLQLERRKDNSPSFAELLLLLRTEEDRQAAKAARMRQHLGTSKQRAAAHLQYACTCADEEQCMSLQKNTLQLTPCVTRRT